MTNYIALQNALIQRGETDLAALSDAFELVRQNQDHDANGAIRRFATKHILSGGGLDALDLYKKALLFDARVNFDAYLQYVEFNRPREKKFYIPRRRQLKPIVDEMQRLAINELELLAISLPPGVGKTTLSLFFLTWLAGKEPANPILSGSHSNAFLRGAYEECLRILDPQGEYLWKDVFPNLHVIKTNAQDMLIDIGEDKKDAKRFPTLEFSSIGSGNAGKVRAMSLLYCDDLVSNVEESMSRERMDKLYQAYTVDFRQRKIGKCRELHVSTRWSVHDVVSRLEQAFEGSDKAKFVVVPALDENDQSNFDYPIDAGFTTEFYHKQRDVMDDASWRALYMNQPIEREGQLYSPDELRRYFELPDKEPDAIISVCDTKDRGTDYCVMPIAYQYGQDYYIESVICDNSKPEVVEPRLTAALLAHKVQMSRFESNAAGGKIAEKVQSEVKAKGGITKITTKFSTTNKETRIIVASPYAKEHFLFKDDSVLKHDREYRAFMKFLTSYTLIGKNKFDDVADAISMLADYCESFSGNVVRVFRSPF